MKPRRMWSSSPVCVWSATPIAAADTRTYDPLLDNPRGGPHCRWCDNRIEWCVGVDSDWMHTATRRERCMSGDLAAPITVADLNFAERAKQWRMKATR